ncbi:MAG: DNA alkylation repair protein [Gemmatimonadetes bacterium]|nr:DNA alkylation repair protein [Gemmatimonadota bacterium]
MTTRIDVEDVRARLAAAGTPERAVGAKAYLKSDLEFLGARVPDIRRIAKSWLRAHPDLSRTDLIRAVRATWRPRVHELRNLAGVLLELRSDLLAPADLALLERMIREAGTWAYVDLIAIRAVGSIAERFDVGTELDRWSVDEDFWVRRSAMLALLLPLRRGEGDWDRFVRYADSMIEEKEFFIRKAIGWVLRDVSKVDPDRVIRFLEPRVDRASGLTLREGLKYVDEADRERLLTRSRARARRR